MNRFNIEPISIPTPVSPTTGIPLLAASDASTLPLSGVGAALETEAVSSSTEAKALARQRDFERLSAALANSEIRHEDLQVLANIGHGSAGVVQKVLHTPSNSVLALKVIPVSADEAARRSILLELKTLHESRHPGIVSFYGAYYREGAVHLALEYMDASLLDLQRATGAPLAEPVLAAISSAVLHGLVYLHKERRTIHRDIKPSNLLVDAAGNVKIADFGVSGELSCTLSKCTSWVGTMHYMAPERITAAAYNYNSDVWSFGITILELAIGAFPYAPTGANRLVFWDLLHFIVENPAPVPPTHFSPDFQSFVSACLQKDPAARATSTQLLEHPLLALHATQLPNVGQWIRSTLASMPQRNTSAPEGGDTDPATLSGTMGRGTTVGHSDGIGPPTMTATDMDMDTWGGTQPSQRQAVVEPPWSSSYVPGPA
mmetsp:Transcript_26217/g.79629  ORF Transcript_26217/g.79629 Transcript_26217/m.79629 type:complete len:431 (-) Transcript_26217:298-1590(-)